jgi:hypothetical protein
LESKLIAKVEIIGFKEEDKITDLINGDFND